MRLLLSLSSSSSWTATLTAFFLTALALTTTTTLVIHEVKADLKYYVYVNKETNVVVLESFGSLPFNESVSTRDGDSCPVHSPNDEGDEGGGINPHYLCIGGPSSRHNNNSVVGGIEFFPIGSASSSAEEESGKDKKQNENQNQNENENQKKKKKQQLPFKFSSFEESYGTSSGLLLWRDVLAIDSSSIITAATGASATGNNNNNIINGTSFGIDKSNENYNSEYLLMNNNDNDNDNDNNNNNVAINIIIAEWYLLNKINGEPILNGGLIQLIKGKPPPPPSNVSSTASASTAVDVLPVVDVLPLVDVLPVVDVPAVVVAVAVTPDSDDTNTNTTKSSASSTQSSFVSPPISVNPRGIIVADDASKKEEAKEEELVEKEDASTASTTTSTSTSTSASSNNCISITESICSDENDSNFSTFCSLLIQVGLDNILNGAGKGKGRGKAANDNVDINNGDINNGDINNGDINNYTVYVPTNNAFLKYTYKDEFPRPSPQMLSGHDLTKLLLNHIIDDTILQYDDMICGTKTYMSNGQITKTGCNDNADVSYVMGSGNYNNIRPQFVQQDNQQNQIKNICNGIIHIVDYVILPSHDIEDEEENHEDMLPEINIIEELPTIEDLSTIIVDAFFKGEVDSSEEEQVVQTKTATTSTSTTTNGSSSSDSLRPVSTKSKPSIVVNVDNVNIVDNVNNGDHGNNGNNGNDNDNDNEVNIDETKATADIAVTTVADPVSVVAADIVEAEEEKAAGTGTGTGGKDSSKKTDGGRARRRRRAAAAAVFVNDVEIEIEQQVQDNNNNHHHPQLRRRH